MSEEYNIIDDVVKSAEETRSTLWKLYSYTKELKGSHRGTVKKESLSQLNRVLRNLAPGRYELVFFDDRETFDAAQPSDRKAWNCAECYPFRIESNPTFYTPDASIGALPNNDARMYTEAELEKRISERVESAVAQIKREQEIAFLKKRLETLEKEAPAGFDMNKFIQAITPVLSLCTGQQTPKIAGTSSTTQPQRAQRPAQLNGLPAATETQQIVENEKKSVVIRLSTSTIKILKDLQRIEPEMWQKLLANIVKLHDTDESTYKMARNFLIQ